MTRYVSPRPGTRMSPRERVDILLTERKVYGRPLVFVDVPATGDGGRGTGPVHVVGPDEDQPAYRDMADYFLNRKVRTVCGLDIRRTALQGTHIGVFDDERLCRRCHHRFIAHGGGLDAAAVIFADNTEDRQDAASVISSIRAHKRAA